MASFNSILFLLHILAAIGITGAKIYNVMDLGKLYDLKWSFLLFFGYVISWFWGLTLLLHNRGTLFSTLFLFTSLLFALNGLFLMIELMYRFMSIAKKPFQAHKAITANNRLN